MVPLALTMVLGPALICRTAETCELDEPRRRRLLGLCEAQGFRVRDVRAIRTRSSRVANAMMTGVVPSFRYILVTDHLFDNVSDDELDAIVAHEIAHGRHHHLLIKTGSWLGLVALLEISLAVARIVGGAVGLIPLLALIGLLFLQGRIGIALEEKADDYACEQVGVGPTVRALEKLTSLNMLKRRTGRVWDALQQHPGMERRIARLEARAAVPDYVAADPQPRPV